jgi:long-chain acyl-CoA synthetase
VIKEKYADIIETIYSEQEMVHIDTIITFQDGNTSRVQTDVRIIDLQAAASTEKTAGRTLQQAV